MKNPNRVSLVITLFGLLFALAFASCKKEDKHDDYVTITVQDLYDQTYCVDSPYPNNENMIYKIECGPFLDSFIVDDPILVSGLKIEGLGLASEYEVIIHVREFCPYTQWTSYGFKEWHYLSTMAVAAGEHGGF